MKKITEVSRRSMYHLDEGIACGPVSSTAIITEIVVDADGQRVFLHGEWVDIAGDYYYEATHESLFDVYEKMFNAESEEDELKAAEEQDRISKERITEDSIFEPYYAEMEQMIHDEMKAHGEAYFYEDEDEDEEEDDEDEEE